MVLQNVQQREADMNPRATGEMQYVKGTSLTSFS